MAHAERRNRKPTGWFRVDIIDAAGTRHRERFKALADAELFEAHVRAKGSAPEAPDMVGSSPTLAKVLKDAEAAGGHKGRWKRSRRPGVQAQQRAYVVRWLGPGKAVTAVTSQDMERLEQHLESRRGRAGAGSKLSPKTVNRYLAAASSLFRYAVKQGWIAQKPVIPYQEESEGKLLWLTEDQEDALIDWLRGQGFEAEARSVAILCACGLRWGEFERLTPFQVRDHGKVWKISVELTKNNKPRFVSIVPELGEDLSALLRTGARPTYYQMRMRVKAAVAACGWSDNVTIHTFRHTTATRLARLGKNPKTIMDFMGHKTLSTTMKYIHMDDDMQAEAALDLAHGRGERAGHGHLRVVKDQ